MEITSSTPVWLDKDHPNFLRWEKARNISLDRGRFVKQILNQFSDLKNLAILDLGSGEGGTTKVLSENNFVVSLDISFNRLIRQKENYNLKEMLQANAIKLPFADSSFDLIIIQDVLEHIEDNNLFHQELERVIKPNGIIYLSTPNKFSLINFFSDPHWGVPLISILNRKFIRNFFLKFFRKTEKTRNDIPQLLSLTRIQNLFSNKFEVKLMTDFAVNELFKGNKGIAWSDFHLLLTQTIKKIKADRIVKGISNNKFGFVNKFLTPTFYLVIKRRIE